MTISDEPRTRTRVPRDSVNDYTNEAARARREFVGSWTGTDLHHVGQYSIDPSVLPGNIENFTGVAQVPIGVAGPLRIHGEHAQGDFYVPLATTEGTLVASYNRGMRLILESGGVRATVVDDLMQRSPVFKFQNAVEARDFGIWINEHIDGIRTVAESTTRSGRLSHIGQHVLGPLLYLRVNYTTGDAAGQNMTGKATLAACEWIKQTHPSHPHYMLSSNTETDKKYSHINTLLTRGKRVVAEATIKGDLLSARTGLSSRAFFQSREVVQAGAFMAGSASNDAHAANGLAALFIATGQDAASVTEAHSAIVYMQQLDNDDVYWSVTLPALIVATHGGGTGLPTQRECLQMLGCYGAGKVRKLAEICAALVLAGDISLVSAIVNGDWVSSHDEMGRNR
jgi:hydroxymethylglutaryl-CoA reductase (NADPH)